MQANVIAEIPFSQRAARRYLLGAHYDSVRGTAGADDNARAVAVQLETLDYQFMAELVESLLHFFCGGEALS